MPDATTALLLKVSSKHEQLEAVDLLGCIGRMLADGELGRLLVESGDRGARLRTRLLAAILDVTVPSPKP